MQLSWHGSVPLLAAVWIHSRLTLRGRMASQASIEVTLSERSVWGMRLPTRANPVLQRDPWRVGVGRMD